MIDQTTSGGTVKTQLRMPPELHAWLQGKSKAEHRSMNGQIVELLEAAKRKAPEARQA